MLFEPLNGSLTIVSSGCMEARAVQRMALTEKKAGYGWQHQAERLALNHTSVATTVVAATKKVRQRPLLIAVPNHSQLNASQPETTQTQGENESVAKREVFIQSEQQAAREAAAEWIRNARRETLAARIARAAAADNRIADLEADLESAHERIALLENENHSLQSSLDITADENSRLCDRLQISDAACCGVRLQLEETQSTLASAVVEHDRLASAGKEARAMLEKTQAALTATEAERDKWTAAGKEARARLERVQGALAATEAERDKRASAEKAACAKLDQVRALLAATEAERASLSFAVNEARAELDQTRATLAATKAERITLSFMLDETNGKRRIEIDTVNARLAAITERAITTEKLLATAQHRLLARTAENCSIERKFIDVMAERDAAHKKLEALVSSLQVSERKVEDLSVSRSELIEVTTMLLKALKKGAMPANT